MGRKRTLKGLESFSSIQLHSYQDDPSDIGDLSESSHQLEPISDLEEEDSNSVSLSQCSVHESLVNVPQLARNDTVTRWKTFVMCLLLINAGLVTISTFEFMRREEEEEFELAFNTAARTVSDASHYHAHALVDTLENFGETVTSYAMDSQVQWPLISIPHFERRASLLRHESFLNLFGLVPIVNASQREAWEDYSVQQQSWIQDSYETRANSPPRSSTHLHSRLPSSAGEGHPQYQHSGTIPSAIHNFGDSSPSNSSGPHAPLWQLSPPPPPESIRGINSDLLSGSFVASLVESMFLSQFMTVSEAFYFELYKDNWFFRGDGDEFRLDENATYANSSTSTPESIILYPIYDGFDVESRNISAFALGLLPWEHYFSDLLPDKISGVLGVLQNSCGQVMSFAIDGPTATFLAAEDLHEPRFASLMVETEYTEFQSLVPKGPSHQCHYKLQIYPTIEFRLAYTSTRPEYFALGLALLFLVTGVAFFMFVYVSRRRQRKVMAVAVSTSAIVASMFPSPVRERILQDAEEEAYRVIEEGKQERHAIERSSADIIPGTIMTTGLLSYDGSNIMSNRPRSRPIADVFPEVTIMFGDIVGFTAWSSVREPQQVFELLETIYHAFDEIAKRRRVYKVETIGDCYVACAGLPTTRADHAVIMARFVRECFSALDILTKQLERSLGPDTGELTMRFGLHSGPCTAGVLRGDRARYQLFGDTVNMAACMESSSEPGHIQISQDTAELLAAAKKSSWFIPRDHKVQAKGKGEVQTYWLHPKKDEYELKNDDGSEAGSVTHHWLDLPDNIFSLLGTGNDTLRAHLSEQNQRLAEWNSNQLLKLLNQLVKQRNAKWAGQMEDYEDEAVVENAHIRWTSGNITILDEVKDSINMPRFDPANFPQGMQDDLSALSDVVIQQLHDYVSIICSMYNKDNPFHNYQHASHVTMNVVKLLSRIVSPPRNAGSSRDLGVEGDVAKQAELYDKSFGIAADPMAQFAVAFAALIKDVDHPGVTNAQLVREGSRLARVYDYVSISEQNSFTVAWDLLMDPMFSALRTTIYTNREEFDHFREVVVNAVMATDLYNDEANTSRIIRWERAFCVDSSKSEVEDVTPETSSSSCCTSTSKSKLQLDRKAALVIECIMQASDISNLMQHWHVYRKWNEREFKERCRAYQQGRESQNPAQTWYQRQLDIFDNIGIPLAKKLKEAGVFGSYSDDYLIHAKKNREEWFRKGTSIVQTMEQNFAEKHNDKTPRTPSRSKLQAVADVSAAPPSHRSIGMRRSHSEDAILRNRDQQHGGRVGRRRPSNDGAPIAPRRSTNNILDPAIAVADVFSQLPGFRRTLSDGAPSHPRRSHDSVDLTEASRAVREMLEAMPAKKEKRIDDAPRTPRRSRDSVEMSAIARQAEEGMPSDYQQLQQTISPKPRRRMSKDVVEMAAAVDQLLGSVGATSNHSTERKAAPFRASETSVETTVAKNLDGSLNTASLTASINSQSVDTGTVRTLGNGKNDTCPRTPTRRATNDDESTTYTMEKIPEQPTSTSTTASSSKPYLPRGGSCDEASSNLDQDESIISECDEARLQRPDSSIVSDYEENSLNRRRLDQSLASDIASDNDESTLLTMGKLWTSTHQRDWASHADDSTIFTREQTSVGPTMHSRSSVGPTMHSRSS